MKELFYRSIVGCRNNRIAFQLVLMCIALLSQVAPAQASGVPFQPGDVLVSVGIGTIKHFNSDGTLLDVLNTSMFGTVLGLAFDPAGNLYATLDRDYTLGDPSSPGSVEVFDNQGNRIGTFGTPYSGTSGSGYTHPTSIRFDNSGNGYVGDVGHEGFEMLWKFPAGMSYSPQHDFWLTFIDLAADQCTLHYNSGDATIRRFNVCTGAQMSNFSTLPDTCYGLRIRPNFEELVVCAPYIYRLDSRGTRLRSYLPPNTMFIGNLALDPDDKSFWVSDFSNAGCLATRIDIATGSVLKQFNVGTDPFGSCGAHGIVIVNGETHDVTITGLGPCEDECNARVGHPINITNGNTYIEAQDYDLPGLGGGLTLRRTWNSRWLSVSPISQAGLFGDSWRSIYEEQLQMIDSLHLKYWRGDGSFWSFQSVSGVWKLQSPANQYVNLTFNSSTGQFTLAYRDGSQKIFTQTGYLIGIKDRNGNTATVAYDTSNRITQVTDAAGRSLSFMYGDSANPNQVTSVSDSVGTVATYVYDTASRLLQVQYADGTINSYTYDSNGLITSVLDNEGTLLEAHTYDGLRRGLSSQRASAADLVTVTYGINGTNSVRVADSAGTNSDYLYTRIADWGKVTSVLGTTCASCGAQGPGAYTFDARGNRTSSTDALGNVTTFTYDSFDDVLTRSVQVGSNTITSTFTYNGFGEVLTATDPLGFTTTNTYDAKGNLLTSTTPSPGGHTNGSTTSFAYDTKGQLLTLTDPLNHATRFTYTPAGLVETLTDAQNKVTRFEYDSRANRTAAIDALSQRMTFAYDSRNRLTTTTLPTLPATSTSITYDSRGRRTSSTDANGKTTTYAYDDADRLTTVTDAQTPAGVTRYTYDSENNLRSISDALGRTTQFEYNTDRRIARTIFPSLLRESYTYDANGNLTAKTDRKNQTIYYYYDALGRLTRKQYSDFSEVDYSYDAASRLTQVTDSTGTYQFTYDNMGRLIGTSTAYAFISGRTFTVDYEWDAASNRTSMTDPQRGDNTYTYDTLNRIATLKNPQRNQFSFTYDALGRRTQLTRPNSVNTNYQYDSLSRVTSLLHQFTTKQGATTTLDGAQYSYDAASNRLSRTDKQTNIVSNYTYDPLYELTSVMQGATTVESYTFDAVGNRLSSTGVPSYNYNTSNELTDRSGATYTYDNNGNLESKRDSTGTTYYSWDFENRLTRVTLPDNSQVNFKYDPMGRRIQKSSPSGTVNYLYDQANILEELDATGAVIARYTHSLSLDEPLSMVRAGTTSYFEWDGLGNVTSLSNSSGALASTYTYDSFGKLVASTGTLINPFRFTGREMDPETGLIYSRSRYYDPQIGRFLSEDPIGFGGGANFYGYVGNDPVGYRDPLGLYSVDDFLYDSSQFVSGAGDNLSFGLTSVVRDWLGTNDIVNKCSGLYSGGQWLGTGIGIAFGAAHLGRTAVLQAGEGGLSQGIRRLIFDERTWGAVRSTWSEAAGAGEPFLRDAGQSLHHWLIPQRWDFVPQGIRNAGFNYMPITASLNSWMNGSTLTRTAAEWGFKGVVGGIYGSLFRGRQCACGH